jgi:hypothetical protein
MIEHSPQLVPVIYEISKILHNCISWRKYIKDGLHMIGNLFELSNKNMAQSVSSFFTDLGINATEVIVGSMGVT